MSSWRHRRCCMHGQTFALHRATALARHCLCTATITTNAATRTHHHLIHHIAAAFPAHFSHSTPTITSLLLRRLRTVATATRTSPHFT